MWIPRGKKSGARNPYRQDNESRATCGFLVAQENVARNPYFLYGFLTETFVALRHPY